MAEARPWLEMALEDRRAVALCLAAEPPHAELTPWHLLGRYPGPFGFETLPGGADVQAALPAIDAFSAAICPL